MSDEDDGMRPLPDKVVATRSYATDSLAPFTPLGLPDEMAPPPTRPSSRPIVVGVLLGFILFFAVVTAGAVWVTVFR